jgi:preprotein translocase subunit SecD
MTANSPHKEVVDVQSAVLFDRTAVKSAEVQTHEDYSVIAITFSDDARKRFAEFTRQNIGKRLAIIIDGQICSAPKIMAEIAGGKAEVSGSFTEQEARDLAKKITQELKK